MARIFKRKGDEHWWLDYFDTAGKRRRVKTNTTSRRAAEDLLAEVRTDLKRIQLGLEVAPTSTLKTVDEAWRLWLREYCPEASKSREERRFASVVADSDFAARRLMELSGDDVQRWLNGLRARGQSASYVNGHRRILRGVINSLIKRGLFRGMNPVKASAPIEEPEFAYEVLSEPEFWRVTPHLDGEWHDMAVLAFCCGLRRGEIFALRKNRTVVDLEARTLTIRASNARELPKGKRVKSIPLFEEGLAVLRRRWDATKHGELLFPGERGGLRSEHSRAAEIFRGAMARAGLVKHWDHHCRGPRCSGRVLEQPDEQQRKCPQCSRIMWPHPIVRQVRFHDLRHSFATYLLNRGVDLAVVSRLLRHSSLQITEKYYAHRTVESLRTAVERSMPATAAASQLETLAAQVGGEAAELLRETARKVALMRHPADNVVPLISRKGE